jgi:bifunctional ADP-heptose synthase (sugar kinase/adenylyltransferase)
MEVLEESRLVRSWGGRSLTIPLVHGYSSSTLLQRLHDAGPALSDDSVES